MAKNIQSESDYGFVQNITVQIEKLCIDLEAKTQMINNGF